MNVLWLLTKKNLKLLLRSKASALIVIFAPLLIILILGLSYNTSSRYGLNIGIYASSFTDDVNSFVALLQEQEFKIVKYTTSIDECIQDIKSGFVHTCINVPESLTVEGNAPTEIVFYIDPSRINLVWMIQETLKSKFDFKAQQISQQLSQEIISRLTDTKTKIVEKSSQLGAAKERSAAASTTTESVKTALSQLDLAPPAASYDLTPLTALSAKLSLSRDKVAEAKAIVDGTNISASDKSSIKNALTAADDPLEEAVIIVNASDATGITGLITIIQTDVNAATAKLTAAASSISSSSSNLDTAASSLRESIASLESVQSTLNEIKMNLESQKVTEPSTIAAPLITKVKTVSPESTYLNYLFPALLVVVIMFSSLLLGTTLVMMEKNSPAFLRNFFLPIRKTTFIVSTYLTNLILILVQIIIILGISVFFLKDALPAFPSVALVLFLAASVFTFLGMGLGYLFVSEETGVLASISLGSLLLFLSGVILPLESVSPAVRNITAYNPFVLAEKLIREIFFFKSSIPDVSMDLFILLSYAVVLFLVIVIAESILHQRLVNRFMKHFHRQHREAEKQARAMPPGQ